MSLHTCVDRGATLKDVLAPEQLKALRRLSTCTVSNAIEAFEERNTGFADASIRYIFVKK